MAEGDRQRNDYPSYGDEFLKCREFLQKYSEGEDNLPYQVQLVRILYLVVVTYLVFILVLAVGHSKLSDVASITNKCRFDFDCCS
jgi:hypothetical protein